MRIIYICIAGLNSRAGYATGYKCFGCHLSLKSVNGGPVEYLGNVGISAIAVEDNTAPEFVQMIKNGVFMVVYCSPECALSTTTWKEIFDDSCFREKLVGVAVDEDHCIPQWYVLFSCGFITLNTVYLMFNIKK